MPNFKLNTTLSQLFIVEMEAPFTRQMIQFVPEIVSVPRTASIQKFAVVGNNNELFAYTTGAESLSLNLEFYAQDDGRREVFEAVNWLKSLTLSDGIAGKYKKVLLVFGDLFKYDTWIITAVTPDYQYLSAQHNWMPLRAKCRVDLMLDPDRNLKIDDVRNR